jgi:hypothetical protein
MDEVRCGASTSFPPPLFGHLCYGDINTIESPKKSKAGPKQEMHLAAVIKADVIATRFTVLVNPHERQAAASST